MKTTQLIIGNPYMYEGKKVIYIGEKSGGLTFFEFSYRGEFDIITIFPLWEHEVNERISDIITKELKLKVLKEVLHMITEHAGYNMCEQIRLLTEKETGEKYNTGKIQEIYLLNQFRPAGMVTLDNWWPLDDNGQIARKICLEKLIEDLNK